MISEKRIKSELDRTLKETNFAGLGEKKVGKVRDSYRQADRRIMITTDRISAFDWVLGTVPFKGQVLTQLAAFWFEKSRAIAPNHVLDVPDPNVMVVTECEQLPIEMIVRGYITGVTKTSLWYNYENGVRDYCGNVLPEGLRKDQKLPATILTPTTKLEKHDRPVSREQALAEGLLDQATFDQAAELCFRLYEFGVRYAQERGLILVDTKYELGRRDGNLMLSDEVHTPDSSRYWFTDTYESLFKSGSTQRKIDKEYVREWYVAQGYRGDGPPPPMTPEVRVEAAKRYIQAYEVITGQEFIPLDGPIDQRIERALMKKGYIKK